MYLLLSLFVTYFNHFFVFPFLIINAIMLCSTTCRNNSSLSTAEAPEIEWYAHGELLFIKLCMFSEISVAKNFAKTWWYFVLFHSIFLQEPNFLGEQKGACVGNTGDAVGSAVKVNINQTALHELNHNVYINLNPECHLLDKAIAYRISSLKTETPEEMNQQMLTDNLSPSPLYAAGDSGLNQFLGDYAYHISQLQGKELFCCTVFFFANPSALLTNSFLICVQDCLKWFSCVYC